MKTARLKFKLLSPGENNSKLSKNSDRTAYLALMPHTGAATKTRAINVCAFAGACARDCVAFAGRGRTPNVSKARKRKTRHFFDNRAEFLADLKSDLDLFDKSGGGLVRLNAYSDLPWELWINLGAFGNIDFYDYTKDLRRALDNARNKPRRFSLCYSFNENTPVGACGEIIRAGGSVAVVIDWPDKPKPTEWVIDGQVFPAMDGDTTDDRRREVCGGYVILLAWKGSKEGKARAMAQGFCASTVHTTALTVSARGKK